MGCQSLGNHNRNLLVLGIGNFMCGDDGIGSIIANDLITELSCPNVDVIDGGTIGLGLLYLMAEYSDIIIIDSVDCGVEPGEIIKFRIEDLDSLSPGAKISFHQSGVFDLLHNSSLIGSLPDRVAIMGIQIKATAFSAGLSPELKDRFPELKKQIKEEISSYFN